VAEELVPQGRAYGERKKTEELMAQAGVARDLPAAVPQPGATEQRPVEQPLEGDPLLSMQPTGPGGPRPPSVREQIAEVAASSQNPTVREAMRRILGSL
jgi:hypothetical protein